MIKNVDCKMISTFHDVSDVSYDRKIEEARQDMSIYTNPCDSLGRLNILVNYLRSEEKKYTPRPCNSGWCAGLFTPHRDRIRDRITQLSAEIKDDKQFKCKEYNKDKVAQKRLDLDRDIADMHIKAAKEATVETTVKEIKTGIQLSEPLRYRP